MSLRPGDMLESPTGKHGTLVCANHRQRDCGLWSPTTRTWEQRSDVVRLAGGSHAGPRVRFDRDAKTTMTFIGWTTVTRTHE